MSNLFAARVIGVLFLLSTSSYLTASHLLGSVMQLPNNIALEAFFPNKSLLTLAALLEFINSAAVIGIAVVIYPIVKQYSERAALSYLVFRVVEAIMLLIGAVLILTMVSLSDALTQPQVQSALSNTDYLHILGKVVYKTRFFNFQMGMIALALCSGLLCATLYQYRLLPRWLSALGLLGYSLLLLKIMLDWFAPQFTSGLLYTPGALFELILPFWLFVKGFDLAPKTR